MKAHCIHPENRVLSTDDGHRFCLCCQARDEQLNGPAYLIYSETAAEACSVEDSVLPTTSGLSESSKPTDSF